MMKKSRGEYRVGVGASSVLMILVVLAMTALGLLSLGSARQTEAQTARNLQTTLDYYGAAASAQDALSKIDAAACAFLAQGGEGPLDSTWFERSEIDADFYDEGGGVTGFAFSLPSGDEHKLVVKGTVSVSRLRRVEVSEHALVSTYAPPEADALHLMGE